MTQAYRQFLTDLALMFSNDTKMIEQDVRDLYAFEKRISVVGRRWCAIVAARRSPCDLVPLDDGRTTSTAERNRAHDDRQSLSNLQHERSLCFASQCHATLPLL